MQNTPLELFRQISASTTKVVLDKNNKPVEQALRIPVGDEEAVIDALNVVIDAETINDKLYVYLNDNERTEENQREIATQSAQCIADILGCFMGCDFTQIYDTGVSKNFYKYTYRIGEPDMPLGLIGIGNANSESILIMIYGEGCHCADDFWEFSLHSWLTCKAVNPRITRCDIALDDFEGKYSSAMQANQADTDGKFALTNRLPNVQHLGDWKRHVGKGRTLQVGNRQSGKLYRGYEKGKQLGDTESEWFRHEIELANKSREIPLDVLIAPTQFWAGAYPYLYEILIKIISEQTERSNMTATKIHTIKKTASISLDKAIAVTKNQFGKYIKVFRDLFDDDTQILDALVSDKQDYYPKRLKIIEKFKYNPPSYFHVSNGTGEITQYAEVKTKHVKSEKVKLIVLAKNWDFLSSIKPPNHPQWST